MTATARTLEPNRAARMDRAASLVAFGKVVEITSGIWSVTARNGGLYPVVTATYRKGDSCYTRLECSCFDFARMEAARGSPASTYSRSRSSRASRSTTPPRRPSRSSPRRRPAPAAAASSMTSASSAPR